MKADLQGFLGAFLDERAHGSQVDAIFARLLTARVNGLEPRVTAEEKMIQAKSVLIQRSSRGAVTSTFASVTFRKFPIHGTPASQLSMLPHFIRFRFFLDM